MASDKKRSRVLKIGIAGLGHLTGISVLFALYCLVFMTETAVEAIAYGLADEQLAGRILLEGALIFGVTSTLWAFSVIVFRLVKQNRKARKQRVLKLNAGTILTETLIVLPVFFLLLFGLAQMGINSMAGLLTTLGTYNAARTVAVWAPEINNDRSVSGPRVSRTIVERKAAIAGAGVVAPVVAATSTSVAQCRGNHPEVMTMLSAMQNIGVAPEGVGETQVWSLAEAFGSRPFATRAASKYIVAACASSVTIDGNIETNVRSNARNELTVTYTYEHRNVFPLVRRIFGTPGTSSGAYPTGDSTTEISRTYAMYQQITPNDEMPLQNLIESALGGIGSWRD